MLKVIFRSLIQIVLFKWGWSRYRNTSPILSQVVLINFECTCPFVPMNIRIDKFQSHHLWYCQQMHSWGEVLFHLHIRRKFPKKKKKKNCPFPARSHSFITSTRKGVRKSWNFSRIWLIYCSFLWMGEGGSEIYHFLSTS